MLRRIVAQEDFEIGGVAVSSGELGGWIEKDDNLSGDAWVYGNARVSGDAHYLTIGPIGSRDETTTFTRDAAGAIYVKCGCFYCTIEAFRAKVRETHGDNEHARAYRLVADLAEARIDTTPIKEED